MTRIAHSIMLVSYILGLLSVVLAFTVRFITAVGEGLNVSPRGGLIFAGVLFLCTVASHAVERP